MKYTMVLMLWVICSTAVIGQTNEIRQVPMKLYNIEARKSEDTVLLLKNYIERDSAFRVVVKSDSVSNMDVIHVLYEYIIKDIQGSLGKLYMFYFADSYPIEDYYKIDFFLYYKEKGRLLCRYKVKNKKIIAINVFPEYSDEFTPIKEYEKEKYDNVRNRID